MKMDFEQLFQMAKKADQEDRSAEAVELFKAAFNMNPSMSAFGRMRLADNLRIIGRFNEAAEVFEAIKDEDVPSGKLWLVRLHKGQLYVDKRDMQSAVACFEQAIERAPTKTGPYVLLGGTYATMQEPEKAIEILLRGLLAEGDRDEVYLNLGYNYRTKGQYALAKDAFEKALEISPSYPEAEEALKDVTSALEFLEAAAE